MKLLVRATNWIGDAVLSIPALEALRRRRPQDEIVILARPGIADLYRGQGFADREKAFDDTGRHSGLWGRERLVRELRRERFDAALLLQNAFEAAWLVWRAGIPQRIGYARDGRSRLLTQACKPPRRGQVPAHESYYYLELLRRAGWMDDLPNVERITLRVEAQAMSRAEELLARAGARSGAMRVALAPGAAYGSAKCWLAGRFTELGNELMAEFDCDVIILGSAAERGVANRIAAQMRRRPMILAGETSLADLPALLGACGLFVGNDSGAMHVAAAVGLPVVAIFGPTDAQATSAVTPELDIVRHPVTCSPCFLRTCPVDHRCMTRIEVAQVAAAARRSIKSRQPALAARRTESA